MEIILVRHCETDWNKQNRCQGISDISLNNDGLKQAEDLRFYFSDRNIDIMFTSPLKRAIETANIINTDKGLSIKYSEELREMDQGDFEGIPFNTLRDYYSSELKQWRENPENFRICQFLLRAIIWHCRPFFVPLKIKTSNLLQILQLSQVQFQQLIIQIKFFH